MVKKCNSNSHNIKNLDEEASKLGVGGNFCSEIEEELYKKRMEKRKEVQSKRLKNRTLEKSLVIVFTGNGKGKTTASLGMALRTLGHNQKVVIIQFIKGAWTSGEKKALQNFCNCVEWHSLGAGFTWETQNRNEDETLVRKAWELAKEYIKKQSYKLVILDEINIAIKLGYIKSEEIIKFIKNQDMTNNFCHIVLTGRGASKEIIDFADLVTEMKLIKHPFKDQGVKAQECVEY